MNQFRTLKNGEKEKELGFPASLIIKTQCQMKWLIEDLETRQMYRANGNTKIGKIFDLLENINQSILCGFYSRDLLNYEINYGTRTKTEMG